MRLGLNNFTRIRLNEIAVRELAEGYKDNTEDGMVALPFALNLVFNFAFTPIQFGLQNNLLAAIDILLVLGTLVWAMIVIYPRARWLTYI